MTGPKQTATYLAQKRYNDFTAWRSVPNRIYTSSNLANISLEELRIQQKNVAPVVTFDAASSRAFYKQLDDDLNGMISGLDEESTSNSLKDIAQRIFDLKPVINLFEQSLTSAKSTIDAKTYNLAIDEYRQLKDLLKDAEKASDNKVKDFTKIVLDQVKNISSEYGPAGRKIASNVINGYVSEVNGFGTQAITSLENKIDDFLPGGLIGKGLRAIAEPLIGGAQDLLDTATKDFKERINGALKAVTDKLDPIVQSISNTVRGITSSIGNEIQDITRQVLGVANKVIDRGLSAVTTDLRQLQPLAGKYGVNSRVNAQNAPIPSGLKKGLKPLFEIDNYLGGTTSFYPSGYIQGNQTHNRRTTTDKKLVSDKFTFVSPEIDDLRFSVLDSYRNMPGDSLRNPEIANGPSLTTPTIEPIAQSILGNTRKGTIVADLVGTLQSDEQILQPRIG